MLVARTGGIFLRLESAVSTSLLLVIVLAVLPAGIGGCSESAVVTGAPPFSDAEMKTVVINIFGMT